jgi:DinB superfamily
MTDYLKTILTGQFEASLSMLSQCVRLCPPQHWEGRIANNTFRATAYHTLFFVDFYLSPRDDEFQVRDLHRRGGDERSARVIGLPKEDTIEYLGICRDKLIRTMASETDASLAGPSGFSSWFEGLGMSRGELHIYNIRHIQHHTGQLSAYLRRVDPALKNARALRWVRTGWPASGP